MFQELELAYLTYNICYCCFGVFMVNNHIQLDLYLKSLLVDLRVDKIADSGVVRKFFTPRRGDIEVYNNEQEHETGDVAINSLLDGYGGDEAVIVVRIVDRGKEILVLRVPEDIRMNGLLLIFCFCFDLHVLGLLVS